MTNDSQKGPTQLILLGVQCSPNIDKVVTGFSIPTPVETVNSPRIDQVDKLRNIAIFFHPQMGSDP